MLVKSSLRILFLSFWITLSPLESSSGPSILETFKGLGSITPPKYSPIAGAMARDYLSGLRFFGNYGPLNLENKDPLLKCVVKGRRNPQNNEKLPDSCPQDVVTALILWLFPKDNTFSPNRRAPEFKDIVSQFTPSTIGSILNELYKAKENYDEKLVESIEKTILKEIKEIIEKNYEPLSSQKNLSVSKEEILKKKQEEITRQFAQTYNTTMKTEQYPTFESLKNASDIGKKIGERVAKLKKLKVLFAKSEQEKSTLKSQIETLEKEMQELEKQKPTAEQQKLYQQYMKALQQAQQEINTQANGAENFLKSFQPEVEQFAKIVVAASQASRSPSLSSQKLPESDAEVYHEDIVTLALLQFGWSISHKKEDIISLLMAMPDVVAKDKLEAYKASNDVYTQEDYFKTKETYKSKLSPDIFEGSEGLERAGLLGFGFQFFELKHPKKISSDLVPLLKNDYDTSQDFYNLKRTEDLKFKNKVPDCGESSFRDALNRLLFDDEAREFNIKNLERNASNNNMELDPALIAYYTRYPTLASVLTYPARVDWLRVVSFKNNVSYLNKAQIDEEYTPHPVCEINEGLSNMLKVISVLIGYTAPAKNDSSTLIDMTPLNRLLELVSRDNSEWTWQTNEGKNEVPEILDKNVNLLFLHNKTPIFTWAFMKGHFDIIVHVPETDNFLNGVGEQLLTRQEALPPYFSLFLNSSFIPQNIESLNILPQNLSFFLYSRSLLLNVDTRLETIISIAESYPKASFLGLGKRLIDSLKEIAQLDVPTKTKLVNASFESDVLGEYVIKTLGLQENTLLFKNATLLHSACIAGNLHFVEKYKDIGLEVQDDEGVLPLHYAFVGKNPLKVVEYLISIGVDTNALDSEGTTALHFAITHKSSLQVIEELIKNGANVNATEQYGNTALHYAFIDGSPLEIVKYLIENGADIMAANENGFLPFHSMSKLTPLDVVEYLVSVDGNLPYTKSEKGFLPYESAIGNGASLSVIQYLVTLAGGIDTKGIYDTIPLHWINSLTPLDVVKYLIGNGENVNTHDSFGDTPLHMALRNDAPLESIKCLVEKGAEIEVMDSENHTPLFYAIVNENGRIKQNASLDIIKYLVEKGAKLNNVHYVNFGRMSLLFLSIKCFGYSPDIVKFIIENSVSEINKKFNGLTPLHEAIQTKEMPLIKYLIEKGADINVPYLNGETPLHAAVYKYSDNKRPNYLEFIKFLVENGANPLIKDGKGLYPLDMFKKKEGKEFEQVKSLLSTTGEEKTK